MPRVPCSTPCFLASCVHPWGHPMNRKHLSVPEGLTWSLPPGGPCVTVALTGPILGPGEASLSLEAGRPHGWHSLLILLQRPDLCPWTPVGLVNLPAGDGGRGPPTAKSFTHSSHRHSWSLCSASLGVAVAGTGFHSSDKGPGLYGKEWLCMCLPQFQVVEKCYLGHPRLRGQEGMPGSYAWLCPPGHKASGKHPTHHCHFTTGALHADPGGHLCRPNEMWQQVRWASLCAPSWPACSVPSCQCG